MRSEVADVKGIVKNIRKCFSPPNRGGPFLLVWCFSVKGVQQSYFISSTFLKWL